MQRKKRWEVLEMNRGSAQVTILFPLQWFSAFLICCVLSTWLLYCIICLFDRIPTCFFVRARQRRKLFKVDYLSFRRTFTEL